MKNPPVKIKNMPETIQRLRDLKPEIKRKMDSVVESAKEMTSLKAAEKLRSELNKDRLKKYEGYSSAVKELLQEIEELKKTYSKCVDIPYENADEEFVKIIHKLRQKEIAARSETLKQYFNEYAHNKRSTFLSFEKSGIHVTLEEKLTSLQGKCRAYIDSMTYSQRGTRSDSKFKLIGDIMAPGSWWQRLRSWVKCKR